MNECCVLPGREFFWDPSRPCHWGFQVQRLSSYWELILRNGHGLGGTVEDFSPQEGGKLAILLRSA